MVGCHHDPDVGQPCAQVAANWADLTDGTLGVAITIDETGVDPGQDAAWTNTRIDGTPGVASLPGRFDTCLDWTIASNVIWGFTGSNTATSVRWTDPATNRPCDSQSHLYCFEQ